MKKQVVLALVALVIVAIGSLALNGGKISGFFGLTSGTEKSADPIQQAVLDANKNSRADSNSAAVSAALSFEVLKKSSISAKLELNRKIPACPETVDANVLVKNTGNAVVEALKIKASSGVEIRACNNCLAEQLGIGEEKTVFLKLCKQLDNNSLVLVSSANAETIELKPK